MENTEQNRRDYREILFRAADGMSHVSGVILFRETLYQDAADGTPLVDLIERAGAVAGHQGYDASAEASMAGFPGESLTEGLDGLGPQLAKDYERGARVAKWRAVIHIGDAGLPNLGRGEGQRPRPGPLRLFFICQSRSDIDHIVEPTRC